MTSRRKWHNVFCFRSWLGWKQVHQQLVSSRGLCVTVREPGLCLLSQIRRSHWHLSLDWESVAWSTVASWLTVRPAPPQPTSREHQRPPEAGHHSPSPGDDEDHPHINLSDHRETARLWYSSHPQISQLLCREIYVVAQLRLFFIRDLYLVDMIKQFSHNSTYGDGDGEEMLTLAQILHNNNLEEKLVPEPGRYWEYWFKLISVEYPLVTVGCWQGPWNWNGNLKIQVSNVILFVLSCVWLLPPWPGAQPSTN